MPSHSKHAYPGEPERPRVFDGKPLRRSEHQLRADVATTRAEMRKSAAWQTSLGKLRKLSLCHGHDRPKASGKGWGFQHSATMPGAATSSPAALADDVAQQLREAFAFVHPMEYMPSRMTPAQRAAIRACRVASRGTPCSHSGTHTPGRWNTFGYKASTLG
jgi:hypothetical protein